MKSQKTNAFQLAIAGGVLILVLVCATFAWFAVGDSAWVSKIAASIASPDVPSQLNSIEYSPTGGKDATDWVAYDGSESLPIEPGKELHFRVNFTAASTTVTMDLINIDAAYRVPATTAGDTGEAEAQEATTLAPLENADAAAKLVSALQYRVNPASDDDEYSDLSFTDDGTYRTARILTAESIGGSNVTHTYYYDIKMKDEAGNEYMNCAVSFDLLLTFGETVS